MFREQSSLRGALHEKAKVKTDLRIKSGTKGKRNGTLFLPLYSRVALLLSTQKLCETFVETMVGRNECCYQKKHFTSYIIRRVLNICSVATPVPC